MTKHYVSIPDRALCGAAIPHRDAETRREMVAASVAEVTCLRCIKVIRRGSSIANAFIVKDVKAATDASA